MRTKRVIVGAVLMASAASAALPSAPAFSAPVVMQKVWCRYGGCDGGVGVGALIGGVVGGVIAAGAASAAAQQDAVAQQHAASCAQRYRSYDPTSGTFAGKDGRRYVCQ